MWIVDTLDLITLSFNYIYIYNIISCNKSFLYFTGLSIELKDSNSQENKPKNSLEIYFTC